MDGAEAGRQWDERVRRRVLERRRQRRARHESPEEHLPRPGMVVAGYLLEARLGRGGQGTVFRARREGRRYAVKFISLPHAADWAWRELDVLVRLGRAGGLPLEGHGKWPAQQPRFLFLVTPYVRGRPLYAWAEEKNPGAREVARLAQWVARELAGVHRAGVVHRDVKGSNILVREGDGRPVLVDFGVGTYAGAPEVTGPVVPGTLPYMSPEVLRFKRERKQGERHRATPGDDLWALGVVLYWLLTGTRPFEGSGEAVEDAILYLEPVAPHLSNPRVPEALSAVCLRMLRKEPGERYADAAAVDAALEAVLKEADKAWEVPLCEAWGPHNATTLRQAEVDWEYEELREQRVEAHEAHWPVRGKPQPPDEASTYLLPEQEPPSEEPAAEPPPRAKPKPTARSRTAAWVAGAVLVLGLGLWLAVHHPPRAPAPTAPPELPHIPLVPPGQEVAPPWAPPEGEGGAAPGRAATPAPVAHATPPKDKRVKTPPKAPAPQAQTPQPKETGTAASKAGTALLCGTLLAGCPGPTAPQVRPTPPPAECPPDAVRTMKELGLRISVAESVAFVFDPDQKDTTVRPGPGATLYFDGSHWGKLPHKTVFSGELIFGDTHVYGRFTQAHTPEGHTHSVCMELRESVPVKGVRKRPGSGQDTAKVYNFAILMPVERFE